MRWQVVTEKIGTSPHCYPALHSSRLYFTILVASWLGKYHPCVHFWWPCHMPAAADFALPPQPAGFHTDTD